MSKKITTVSKIEFIQHSIESWVIKIHISHEILAQLIIQFDLVLYDLYDYFIINSYSNTITLMVDISKSESTKIDLRSENKYHCSLNRNDAELINSYLLHYYRDLQASVNHLDVEIFDSELGRSGMLIFKAAEYSIPMTSDQAKKLLE